MLPKEERRAMLLRLYNDESPLIDHSNEHRPKSEGSKEVEKTSTNLAPKGGESNSGHHNGGDDHDGNTSSEGERAMETRYPAR